MSLVDVKVKQFLDIPSGEKGIVSLLPVELNPFLRVMEIMGKGCIIEMIVNKDADVYFPEDIDRKSFVRTPIWYNVQPK